MLIKLRMCLLISRNRSPWRAAVSRWPTSYERTDQNTIHTHYYSKYLLLLNFLKSSFISTFKSILLIKHSHLRWGLNLQQAKHSIQIYTSIPIYWSFSEYLTICWSWWEEIKHHPIIVLLTQVKFLQTSENNI